MRMIYTVLFVGIALTVGACGQKAKTEKPQAGMEMMSHDEMGEMGEMAANQMHAMVKLPTVLCDLCKERIETGLMKTEGILSVNVEVDSHMGHVNYDGDQLGLPDVEKAIAALGYQANQTPADPEAYAQLPDRFKVSD